ncbi:transglycosylase family protein [Pseudonocardia sp. ICBG1293]|uniref:transglycosylase family protein n=1 Tax=Pseudonocardia sp. ICBG1293 TaxID=2844382 RepID=UPI0027E14EE6|nr:transglycosylase family protein [Pseudonocardia sp. ICBG1293]
MPAPVASHSGGESPVGTPTSRPEENHGKEHGKDCCADAVDRGGSAAAGGGSGEQVSRSGSGRGGSGTNTATVASDGDEAGVEDARAAVALLGEFLDALDTAPASPIGAAGEASRVVLDAAADSGRGTAAVGSAVAAASGPAAPSERPVDTTAPKSPTSGSSTATRTPDEHSSTGQSSGPQSEGLAAGVEKLTEQAAQAATADPDAVALLETLTDPGLNLDDLDTTTSSSAGSAGETISRTSSSAAPAPELGATAAGNGQDSDAEPSSASAGEKGSGPDQVWDALAECESGGNWSTRTGNGFAGGLQFTPSTWRAFGGEGAAHEASRDEQIAVAQRVQEGQGWEAWPACSKRLGLTD